MGELRGNDSFLAFPLLMLAATAAGLWWARPEVVAVAALAALGGMMIRGGTQAFGWANGVTWLRICATAGLIGLNPGSLVLLVSAFTIFAFDGVDGAIARATNTASAFGAELDKECDAFFVLMAGVLLWHQGTAGMWVVIPGVWRYAYSLVVALVREMRPAPRSNWGRYSYSTSCICLIASLWRETPMSLLLCALATVLISASFLRSLYYCLPRN